MQPDPDAATDSSRAETLARASGPIRKSWSDETDEALAAAAAKDLDAFAELIRRHQHFVYGAALRIVRNRAIAEELSQETFIRAHRALGSFRGDSHVRSWLYRIASNLAKNAVSRSRETASERLPDTVVVEGPANKVVSRELGRDITEAVDRLPDHLKGPFVMREFEHLSYQEIADATGLQLNTVRTRILRARRSLRAELEDWR